MKSFIKGFFDYSTLTIRVGNGYKGWEILTCVRVPPYNKKIFEREPLSGGWYGAKQEVTIVCDRHFVVLKNGKPYGVLIDPYHERHQIKSDVYPLNGKYDRQIKEFISTL